MGKGCAMQQRPAIRVYAGGRQFVVVPLVTGLDSQPVEVAPAHPVYLTLGRPIAYVLAQAISAAKGQSRMAVHTDAVAWDGEGGRWWTHHLFRATIVWQPDQVVISSGPRAKTDAGVPTGDETLRGIVLPADTPASGIAEWLIRTLGEQLS